MKREEGQGFLAQLECADLWNITSGKIFRIPFGIKNLIFFK